MTRLTAPLLVLACCGCLAFQNHVTINVAATASAAWSPDIDRDGSVQWRSWTTQPAFGEGLPASDKLQFIQDLLERENITLTLPLWLSDAEYDAWWTNQRTACDLAREKRRRSDANGDGNVDADDIQGATNDAAR